MTSAPTPAAQPSASAPKTQWRAWARTLPPVDATIADAIVDHLHRFLAAVDDPVLAYVALRDEVAIERLVRPGGVTAEIVLPRIGDDGTMTLHIDDGARERSSLGMDQPVAGQDVVDPIVLGAVLVPARAFDRRGFRLGRGGGHYDRLLPQLDPAIPVVGVATDARIVDRLPRDDHDRPMTHLVTESGVRAVPF